MAFCRVNCVFTPESPCLLQCMLLRCEVVICKASFHFTFELWKAKVYVWSLTTLQGSTNTSFSFLPSPHPLGCHWIAPHYTSYWELENLIFVGRTLAVCAPTNTAPPTILQDHDHRVASLQHFMGILSYSHCSGLHTPPIHSSKNLNIFVQ